MKLRKIIPQSLKNFGKHLPEAIAANLYFSFPSRKITVVGVTGTDGKTTTVNMVYEICRRAQKKVSMISTLAAVIAGKSYDTGFHVTSPTAWSIQKFLKKAVDKGEEIMILEVTSHALDQFRVLGINFEIGAVTNITPEHLDYHQTFENYLNTKAKLLAKSKISVIPQDDPNFEYFKGFCRNLVTFGLTDRAMVNPKKFPLKLMLPGQHNMLNALAASAITQMLNIDPAVITQSLNEFPGLAGRLESIDNNRGIQILVDFAHTPNALEATLQTIKEQVPSRVIAVFGAASERDTRKRPAMGEIASRLADIVILTDEDPRFEDSLSIIEQIAEGCYKSGAKDKKSLYKIPNRKEAIKKALLLARTGDTIGIFGKGHETSMSYKGKELPWSDRKVVLQLLSEHDNQNLPS